MPQAIPKGLTREHVIKAIADLDAGIDHSFGTPTGYELVHDGKRYAPKSVIGVAFRHITGEILGPDSFSGGEAPGQANFELRRLGFTVEAKTTDEPKELTGKPWSDDECKLLIADYFTMLQLDLIGRKYNKAEHNRLLREKLTTRSKKSVEFKHQNVSAVLLKLGLPCIDGYKPAMNYQRSLVENVQAYLEANKAMLEMIMQAAADSPDEPPPMSNWKKAFDAPPEEVPTTNDPREPWQASNARRVDFAKRDAENRKLGRLGERFAIALERNRLLDYGRDDLAKRVEWVSDARGDGLGYDVLSFDEVDDSERWIEVKTTAGNKYTSFFVTSNELRCSEAMARRYYLYRLFRFAHQPRLYVLHGALSAFCRLDPVVFKATVGCRETAENA
jgi:hypothetical protein